MKKVLTVVSAVILTTVAVKADLMTVTAVGSVYNTYNSQLAIGTHVEYTFQFDTEQNGYYTYGSNVYTLSDYTYYYDNSQVDYFYADFLGNNVLPDYGVNSGASEYNYGYDYTSGYNIQSRLVGGSSSHGNQISSSNTIDAWQVGSSLYGIEYSYNGQSTEYAYSNLTITSLSNVPEPSILSMIFSGVGLLSFGAFRSIRKKGQKK